MGYSPPYPIPFCAPCLPACAPVSRAILLSPRAPRACLAGVVVNFRAFGADRLVVSVWIFLYRMHCPGCVWLSCFGLFIGAGVLALALTALACTLVALFGCLGLLFGGFVWLPLGLLFGCPFWLFGLLRALLACYFFESGSLWIFLVY